MAAEEKICEKCGKGVVTTPKGRRLSLCFCRTQIQKERHLKMFPIYRSMSVSVGAELDDSDIALELGK